MKNRHILTDGVNERVDISDLKPFISMALNKWKMIKDDLAKEPEMASFLKKSYPVVMFDHYQLEVQISESLYLKTVYSNKEKPTPEEVKAEEFRNKMVAYFKNDLSDLVIEIRFPMLAAELIEKIKAHPSIKELNRANKASIRVIIEHRRL